jgi:hypothetical protein
MSCILVREADPMLNALEIGSEIDPAYSCVLEVSREHFLAHGVSSLGPYT